MPSPLPPRTSPLRGFFLPPDSRPCSSPCVPLGQASCPRRLPSKFSWCIIDWDHVRLLHPLGAGGFGAVYKATYHGVPVALKQVKRSAKNRLASQRSFWAELNVARLRHANIVQVLAASTCTPAGLDSLGTVIMEFGGHFTLHQRIYGAVPCPELQEGLDSAWAEPLSLGTCLKYALDVANGLFFLHSQSIVHLDLKPANILISEQDVCKIGDFGCSEKLKGLLGVQKAGWHLGGTYTHRAPELLKGEAITPKADIYSFAITLWQMATQEAPFSGDREYVLYAVVACHLRPPLSAAVFTDSTPGRELESIIRRCWAANAGQRPSADLLLLDLSSLKAEYG